MKIQLGLLETKVARRLLSLFVLCALLPIGALAALSYRQIGEYLESQADLRLRTSATQVERAIADRLEAVESEVSLLAGLVRAGGETEPGLQDLGSKAQTLEAATLERPEGRTALFGRLGDVPGLDEEGRNQMLRGELALVEGGPADEAEGLYVARPVDPADPSRGLLWARVSRDFLWRTVGGAASPGMSIRILDAELRVLHGDPMPDEIGLSRVTRAITEDQDRAFSLAADDEPHRAVTRHLSLPIPGTGWDVLVTQPQSSVVAPLKATAQGLLPIFLTALLGVLLVSDAQIRRTIHPLKRLKEATGRVAREDFGSMVDVNSNDEFEELARSFNAMTRRLGTQFETLTTISEVDRAALSATDARAIIDPLLRRLHMIVGSELVSVCLVESDERTQGNVYSVRHGRELETVQIQFAEADLELLHRNREQLITKGEGARPRFLGVPSLARASGRRFVSLPFFFDGDPAGVVTYLERESDDLNLEALVRARQVTDQISLALSNVRRLRALDRLNWGALTALARTIDANSPWTAGHSERVSTVATLLGQRMGLPPREVDQLQRGALLHDIGKIGVSVEILNKPGPLLDSELDEIRQHTVIGARILEPIPDYTKLIPIVLQHHERVDGRGYPDGLVGEQIDLKARILAVADCLDALISDRPYRRGLPFKTAIEVVRNAAGTQLDEVVVAALLTLVEDDEIDPTAGRHSAELGRFWIDKPVPEVAVAG